jgi:hypothetical protein
MGMLEIYVFGTNVISFSIIVASHFVHLLVL